MIESSEKTGYSFRHSSECTSMWQGESLAGCLKVGWTNGKRTRYDDCCKGVYVKIVEENSK